MVREHHIDAVNPRLKLKKTVLPKPIPTWLRESTSDNMLPTIRLQLCRHNVEYVEDAMQQLNAN